MLFELEAIVMNMSIRSSVIWRRFLVVYATMLWQGGFLFYTAVVVPIGTDYLGSATLQGFITQRVTNWLNYFGMIWIVIAGWDLYCTGPYRKRTRWLIWSLVTGLMVLLWIQHGRLDALVDTDASRVLDRAIFRQRHMEYLWISTAHWVLSLFIGWWTLRAWSADDVHALPSRNLPNG